MIDTTAIRGLSHFYIENIVETTFTPSFRQLLIMPVITSDFSLGVDALEQFAGGFVRRVLGYELAVNSEIEDFALGLSNGYIQISFAAINTINAGRYF